MSEGNKDVLRELADAFNNKAIKRFEDVYDLSLAYHGTGEVANVGRLEVI